MSNLSFCNKRKALVKVEAGNALGINQTFGEKEVLEMKVSLLHQSTLIKSLLAKHPSMNHKAVAQS